MITVLLFSDPDVKRKLAEHVASARAPLLVAQVQHDKYSRPPNEREPFAAIDDVFGDVVDQIIVADDGTPEGMWRDPVGDLADTLFPNDKAAAYQATSGYLLIKGGKAAATVKKSNPAEDLWFLQEALAKHVPGVPFPDESKRPGHKKPPPKAPPPREPRAERQPPPRSSAYQRRYQARDPFRAPEPTEEAEQENTPPPRSRVPREPPKRDPYDVLGIPQGTPKDEAKKAFRALIAQYHPDKVSHLAPEFKELADKKTREILEAWAELEKA